MFWKKKFDIAKFKDDCRAELDKIDETLETEQDLFDELMDEIKQMECQDMLPISNAVIVLLKHVGRIEAHLIKQTYAAAWKSEKLEQLHKGKL